jgi:hypothetical protein
LIEIQALNKACVAWRDRVLPHRQQQADEDGLAAMLKHTKWEVAPQTLTKDFVFKDARTLETFKLRLADLVRKRCEGDPVVAMEGSALSVALKRDEVGLAMGVDELAAELQLGGRWN